MYVEDPSNELILCKLPAPKKWKRYKYEYVELGVHYGPCIVLSSKDPQVYNDPLSSCWLSGWKQWVRLKMPVTVAARSKA
jgi:hypothetical protein